MSRIRRTIKFSRSKGGNFIERADYIKNIESRPKRTPEEQLKHLDEYGFRAVKERAKLQNKIEKEASKSKK